MKSIEFRVSGEQSEEAAKKIEVVLNEVFDTTAKRSELPDTTRGLEWVVIALTIPPAVEASANIWERTDAQKRLGHLVNQVKEIAKDLVFKIEVITPFQVVRNVKDVEGQELLELLEPDRDEE